MSLGVRSITGNRQPSRPKGRTAPARVRTVVATQLASRFGRPSTIHPTMADFVVLFVKSARTTLGPPIHQPFSAGRYCVLYFLG